MTTATKSQIENEIDTLLSVEHHVSTNQGTYGGCDPAFNNREEYETVGGRRRVTGPEAFPGYLRSINRSALAADRKRLADLRKLLRDAK